MVFEEALVEREMLRNVPLFSSLTDGELKDLAAIAARKRFPRDEMVIMQGEEGGSFFLILAGKVKVIINSPQGREITLAILSRDDFFGEMSLIDGRNRSASVMTITETEVMTIIERDFETYLRRFPEVSIKLLKIFIGRLRRADRQIEHLALHSVKGGVARLILDWVVDYGNLASEGLVFDLPYTHKEIAGMLGTSRETVTRTFADLKEEGYLSLVKNRVVVSDLKRIRDLAL
jgi:CRP/FNR family transcriptional regulator, cyclic AMP receptor protein